MQKAEPPLGKWRNLVFFLVASLVATADQLSKIWIRSNLAPGATLLELGFFRIIRVHNTGAAFGLFPGQSLVLVIIGLAGIAAILAYALFYYRHFPVCDGKLGLPALALVLGGTVGNLADRLNPGIGGVTDFISVGIWPAFNVADSAIVVGMIAFAFAILASARTRKPDLPV
jgi:signal peptidase II